jgi:hypothetical protein
MSDDDLASGPSAGDVDSAPGCVAPVDVSLDDEAEGKATSAFSVHSESFYPASYWEEWSYGVAYCDYSSYGVSGYWEQEQKEQRWNSLAQEQKAQEQKEQQWHSMSQWQQRSQQWAYDPIGCAGKAAGAGVHDKTAVSETAVSHKPATESTCALGSDKAHAHAYAAALAAARQPARQSTSRLPKPSARSKTSSSSVAAAQPKRWQVKTSVVPPCTSASGQRWADLED